ncbi:hypothetical protein VPH35_023742 [Triticum aestivum]
MLLTGWRLDPRHRAVPELLRRSLAATMAGVAERRVPAARCQCAGEDSLHSRRPDPRHRAVLEVLRVVARCPGSTTMGESKGARDNPCCFRFQESHPPKSFVATTCRRLLLLLPLDP